MPHAIIGGDQGLNQGWEVRPTGYYPDHNGETMGRFDTPLDNLVVAPYGSPGAPGVVCTEPGSSHDRVDQHPFLNVAATWTPSPYGNGRPDGLHDPLTDGPPRPEVFNASLHYHRRSGASRTTYMDVPDGRRFSQTGTQDGVTTVWYVDTAAALEPFNPDPKTGQHRESLFKLPPGPSHGWSSIPAVPSPIQDADKITKLRRQKNVKQNRLANSTYAGQTYSQQTAHVANPTGGGIIGTRRPRG
jgi:hypothetical protein